MNAVATNVLIYVHDDREPEKKVLARELIDRLEDEEGVLEWQVACEYVAAGAKVRAARLYSARCTPGH
jgi:predicted nucleic acid-binding protein